MLIPAAIGVLFSITCNETFRSSGSVQEPPPVIISFSAANNPITQGKGTVLTAAFLNGNGTVDHGIGVISANSPIAVNPSENTAYTLTVTNLAGATVSATVNVTVLSAPAIISFTAAKNPITKGAGTLLSAAFLNGTGAVDRGIGVISANSPIVVNPSENTVYTLTVTNLAGATVSATVNVTVLSAPAIISFTAAKNPITKGTGTLLSAAFLNGTGAVDHGIGVISSNSPIAVNPSENTVYTLAVTNLAGTTVSATVGVTVLSAPAIISFTVANNPITQGTGTILNYSFIDGSGSIDQGVGNVPSVGTSNIAPSVTTAYTLTITNAAGDTVVQKVTVTVVPAAHITAFSSNPMTILSGGSSTLNTLYENGSGTIDHNVGGIISGSRGKSTGVIFTTTTYTLTVINSAGDSVTATTTVTVRPGTFTATGSMTYERDAHTATLLPNGKVLITGGENSGNPSLSSAELYDPTTETFTTIGPLVTGRSHHAATLLQDGKVLISGGQGVGSALASAEVYDPSTKSFTETGSMILGRVSHTATLLPNGQILIAGGGGTSNPFQSSAEIYDPATGTFLSTGPLVSGRSSHTATLLGTGKVLIAGGENESGTLRNAELYDPSLGAFTATNPMSVARTYFTATLLGNGEVLICEGFGDSTGLASAELYDPYLGAFTAAGSFGMVRVDHTATLLSNGRVLVAGADNTGKLSGAELYDPSTGVFTATGTFAIRYRHTSTRLFNGKVLITGGYDGQPGHFLSSAILYDPQDPVVGGFNSVSSENDEKLTVH